MTVNELRSKQSDLEHQINSSTTSLQSARQQIELLTSQLDDARNRVNESAKLVASNQEV
jgi:chromosome segregation ATPase